VASVTFNHVYKRFGNTTVVTDLNIQVQDKEFLVFVGPSGCGKSTSLRMLAGLEEISDGEILIGDRVVNNVAPKDRDVAMVFQSYALYPHMTVYDNMAFGLKLRKTPKQIIDQRVREAADSLGIGQLLDRRPRQLSGGQFDAMIQLPLEEYNLDFSGERLYTTFVMTSYQQTTFGDYVIAFHAEAR